MFARSMTMKTYKKKIYSRDENCDSVLQVGNGYFEVISRQGFASNL